LPDAHPVAAAVSVLFNEPKLLKSFGHVTTTTNCYGCFSALQRAEIAEIDVVRRRALCPDVSVLFNEPKLLKLRQILPRYAPSSDVSVLFNEPKLLKSSRTDQPPGFASDVSVLFNEPKLLK